MLRRELVFILLTVSGLLAQGQYSLTTSSYNQDFNTLAASGTSSTVPTGWIFTESGTSANTTYTAGTGSSTTGDTYSLGATSAVDRALGGLRSGALSPLFGFYFINNTGSVINALSIQYSGEQWRLGAAARTDRLDCQYSTNAISLSTGVWVDADPLDFTAPITSSPTGALDGNLPANRQALSSFLAGLDIPSGGTFFIRWVDLDATGADDVLAIDDLTITTTSSLPLAASYFRSASSGDWHQSNTWESSADNISWNPAATYPTSSDQTITIRNGHFVSITSAANANELTIESGGTLQVGVNVSLSVDDATGTDLTVNGTLIVNGAQPGGLGNIIVASGGVVRVSSNAAPGQSDDLAFGNANIKFMSGSVFDWNTTANSPSWSGQTYFTSDQIPTFRITQTSGAVLGANTATIINGVLEVNTDVQFGGTANKTIVNGITGTGNITPAASFTGNILITGSTAQLGGSGTITLPASPATLQIGTGTTCTMMSGKTINGDVQILANSYIDAGAYDLMISGNIAGGTTNYVRTASTGSLVLKNVTTGRTFPVGHTRYNPLIIDNGSGHDWTVRVNDGVVADPPNGITGAVLVTWNISPSVNPPAAGADITFQFDNATQTGTQFNTAPYNTPDNVQAWHRKNGYWLGAGVPMPLSNAGGNTRTLKVFGLTQFSPYALSRVMLPLPVELLSFKAIRKRNGVIGCDWITAQACRPGVLFHVEGSMDGILFRELDRVPASVVGTIHARTLYDGDERIRFVRLRILEPDGRVQTGPVVELKPMEREMGIERIWLSGGVLRAAVYSPSSSSARWVVVDMLVKLATELVESLSAHA